ncbi:tyrosine-type recombinase/integrase [Wenyingzhuangia sp. IMCC45533]
MNNIIILFFLKKTKKNKAGKCPMYCRITYLGGRKEFSIGIFIPPEMWNSKKQVCYKDKENNTKLSLIKNKIDQAFLFLEVNKKSFDVDDIYLQYKGDHIKSDKTISDVFKLHNERMLKLVGKSYSKSTYNKFKETENHISNFIRAVYKKRTMLLRSVKMKFINDLEYYLTSEVNQKPITVNKTIQRFRKIIKLAIAEEFIKNDPFLLYKPLKVDTQIVYLTAEELSRIEKYHFKQLRLEHIKSMFIFCCYSGLAFKEMSELKTCNIVCENGTYWIRLIRGKTNKELFVPILKKAKAIIDFYDGEEYVFPKMTNQKFNSYIKEIGDIVGITKNLSHHTARKTFATTVLLANNVPMEIVSAMLGHSRIDITQKHYAKIDLSKWINKLNF